MTYEFFKELTVYWFAVTFVFIATFIVNLIIDSRTKKQIQERQHRILWNQYEKQALEKHKVAKK